MFIAISDQVTNFPRCSGGAISEMYIGSIAMATPAPSPTNALPISKTMHECAHTMTRMPISKKSAASTEEDRRSQRSEIQEAAMASTSKFDVHSRVFHFVNSASMHDIAVKARDISRTKLVCFVRGGVTAKPCCYHSFFFTFQCVCSLHKNLNGGVNLKGNDGQKHCPT